MTMSVKNTSRGPYKCSCITEFFKQVRKRESAWHTLYFYEYHKFNKTRAGMMAKFCVI